MSPDQGIPMNRMATLLVITLMSTFQSAQGAEFLFGRVAALRSINTSGNDHAHLSADGLSLYVTSGPGLGPPFGGGGNKSYKNTLQFLIFRAAPDLSLANNPSSETSGSAASRFVLLNH